MHKVNETLRRANEATRQNRLRDAHTEYLSALDQMVILLNKNITFSTQTIAKYDKDVHEIITLCKMCTERIEEIYNVLLNEEEHVVAVKEGQIEQESAPKDETPQQRDTNLTVPTQPTVRECIWDEVGDDRVLMIPTSKLILQLDSHLLQLQQQGEAVKALKLMDVVCLKKMRIALEKMRVLQFEKEKIDGRIAKATEFEFLYVDAKSVAQQITLIEFEIFKRVHPSEFSKQKFDDLMQRIHCPTISAMMDFSEYMARWAKYQVLKGSSPKERQMALEKFIAIANDLYALANYNSFVAIVKGISSEHISNLTETKALLSADAATHLENFSFMANRSDDYRHIRSMQDKKPHPSIPLLEVYLRDLHKINANKTAKGETTKQDADLFVECFDKILHFQKYEFSAIEEDLELQHWLLTRPCKSTEQLAELSKGIKETTAIEKVSPPPTIEHIDEAQLDLMAANRPVKVSGEFDAMLQRLLRDQTT